jgi:hypothetical protein
MELFFWATVRILDVCDYETGKKSNWTDWNSVGLNPSRTRARVVRRLEGIW